MLRPEEQAMAAAVARPRAGRGKRLGVLSGLGFAAAALWKGSEAFAGGTVVNRPAGGSVVVERLSEGATCRAAYGDKDPDRPEWNPMIHWNGEKTYHPIGELQADKYRQWYHFDAEGKTLGHLSQAIYHVLKGKGNPLFDPAKDVGAYAVVTNCEKVRVSGKKYHYKLYFRNLSRRPGHTIVERFSSLQKRFPERILMKAVWGCFKNNPTNKRIFKERLKLFVGPNHLYYDQNPVEYPMHKIKDCTFSLSLRRRDRIEHFEKHWVPRFNAEKERRQTQAEGRTANAFRRFLQQQMSTQEGAEGMSMEDLAVQAERNRFSKIIEDNVGKDLPKRKINTYIGTQIPRQRIARKPTG